MICLSIYIGNVHFVIPKREKIYRLILHFLTWFGVNIILIQVWMNLIS